MRAEATCQAPVMWSLGEVCAAVCQRAQATGLEEWVQFNAVLLIARPDTSALALAQAYWHAVDAGWDRARQTVLLNAFPADLASRAHLAGEATRVALNMIRGASV